jgi:hypothetical protein
MPTCRETQIDIHHIEGYALNPEHKFIDLIALCPNCHRRVTNGEIPKAAVRQVKANLSVLSHRYVELERRCLESLAEQGGNVGTAVFLPIGFELLMKNLMDDGLVSREEHVFGAMGGPPGVPGLKMGTAVYRLTYKGAEFVEHWMQADPLETE